MAQFQLLKAEIDKMKKENKELRTHVKLTDQKEGDGATQSSDNPIPYKGKGKLVEEDNEGGPSREVEALSKKRRTKPAEHPMPAAFDGKKSLSEFEIWVTDMDAYLKFFMKTLCTCREGFRSGTFKVVLGLVKVEAETRGSISGPNEDTGWLTGLITPDAMKAE
ncbi:hypothetical protein R1sor_014789 [Riccia sorocarpa]|uniref:Uncharacterized protein n=1 Tax=Riccia sorocarpa TaxID=122646 RepID=A0ABD3HDJ9_9MARC